MRTATVAIEGNLKQASDETEELRADFLRCCHTSDWTLPARWLYDHRGSELFEQITHLPEYYPTRTELDLLREAADALRASIGAAGCWWNSAPEAPRRLRH